MFGFFSCLKAISFVRPRSKTSSRDFRQLLQFWMPYLSLTLCSYQLRKYVPQFSAYVSKNTQCISILSSSHFHLDETETLAQYSNLKYLKVEWQRIQKSCILCQISCRGIEGAAAFVKTCLNLQSVLRQLEQWLRKLLPR